MPIIDRIADFHIEMTERRHRIHAHPETAFELRSKAAAVAAISVSGAALAVSG